MARRTQRAEEVLERPQVALFQDQREALGPPERAKNEARALADSRPPKLRLAYAQAFGAAVVTRYWTTLHAKHGRTMRAAPVGFGSLGREGLELALALAEHAARLNVENAAYLVGSTYAAMLPPEYRSKHGVFYTPPLVVRRLLDAAASAGTDWKVARVLDPACGGGAFLGSVASLMVESLKGCNRRVVVRNLSNRLRGYEIDSFAAWLSQIFLEATLHTFLNGAGDDLFDAIDVCDSLSKPEPAGFDLVVGNPPYGRVALTAEQRTLFSRSLYGHANLYGVFLDLAIRKTRAGGHVAYVTPTSFLSGEYFKRLRGLLAAEASPISLDFVEERFGVFDDVLQETLLAVYRRGDAHRQPEVHFVEAAEGKLSVTSGSKIDLPAADSPWLLPRSNTAVSLATRLSKMPGRLADWGYGVSTGPLVWNRYKDQLRHKADATTVPLIWAESVSADGAFSFRAARRNHAPYFAVRKGDDSLLVRRPCVLLQRTTAKEQLRRLIAAELPEGFMAEHGSVTVENHLNMIVPIVEKPAVSTKVVAAFLNSTAADRAFRCISGSVAVSAYELEAMPLPAPEQTAELERIIGAGANRGPLERACERLFEE